jgi:hypothetical protein
MSSLYLSPFLLTFFVFFVFLSLVYNLY